eukprot:4351812-Amphidinium_carterae.1
MGPMFDDRSYLFLTPSIFWQCWHSCFIRTKKRQVICGGTSSKESRKSRSRKVLKVLTCEGTVLSCSWGLFRQPVMSTSLPACGHGKSYDERLHKRCPYGSRYHQSPVIGTDPHTHTHTLLEVASRSWDVAVSKVVALERIPSRRK